MKRLRFAWFAVICLGGAGLIQGLVADPSSASKLEKELGRMRGKIQDERKAIKSLDHQSRNLLKLLEDLDKDIDAAEARHRISEGRIARLRQETREARDQVEDLAARIERQREEQGLRLIAYYRLGKTGMLPLIFSETSPPEKFRNLDAFKKIVVSDWQRLEVFSDLLEERARAEAALQERLEEEKALQEKLRRRWKALEAKRQEKSTLLFRIEQDKKLHERLLEELRRSAKDLEKKIQDEPPALVVPQGGPLSAQKGRLVWPVTGKVHPSSDKIGVARSRGIDIKTEPGAPVRAVWGGGVVFADWFRGYGKIMIIHHGEKDYTVAAHLGRLAKKTGEQVETGEIVGHAGDTGSTEGCLVHFEIWHEGRPDDPLAWLRQGGGGS
jgi:murein hydrolase activator